MPAAAGPFDDRPVVLPPRPPTLMTRHPIAQIALNGNPKSPENRSFSCRFLQNRLLHPQRLASRLNGSAILHGRLLSVTFGTQVTTRPIRGAALADIEAAWERHPRPHGKRAHIYAGVDPDQFR